MKPGRMTISMWISRLVAVAAILGALGAPAARGDPPPESVTQPNLQYEHNDTRELVALVNDASKLIEREGQEAFAGLRVPDSRWRRGESYIFVLDTEGNMLVHPDPALEGENQMNLKDIQGRRIVEGLLRAATAVPGKAQGWYHYEWPVPGGLLPRWKSSYVRLVSGPSDKRFVVGSGVYNDRMERAFVVDMVKDAVAQLEARGESAFSLFHDPTGPFMVKDAYIFVFDPSGVERVNPAHPNLQGRNLMDVKDAQGKPLIREMFDLVQTRGAGWVDYMWPRPGESVSTQKSSYVTTATVNGKRLLVGAGVYLADAPKAALDTRKLTAQQLMTLVREGATLFEKEGDAAFSQFQETGSKWFHDDLYFFVWTLDGMRRFHAADPTLVGKGGMEITDVLGRPYGKMFVEAAASPSGEGWVHYMYPEPGGLFPAWKSVFVKRTKDPSGREHLIGAGIYNMQMDRVFIKDLVDRAAALVEARGTDAFPQLRDRKGPFVFMDTYVFVNSPEGVERVNAAQPSLEGRNAMDFRDINGKLLAREYITAAMKQGSAWVDYYWYKPGHNTPARKESFVRKVESPDGTFIVGSGFYPDEG